MTDREAQMLEQNLRQRYELEWIEARVRDLSLKILQIKDLETFLVQQIEAGTFSLENFPYWAMVWEASLVLADFLVTQEPVPDREILELGAGLGFVGLFAAARGHRVTLTDNHPDALAFARLNVNANNLTQATVQFLDWHHPELSHPYDWLVGSDLLYEPKNYARLAEVCNRFLAPDGRVYLTAEIRGPGPRAFFDLVKERFVVRFQKKILRTGEDSKKILFFELYRKN